MNRRTFIIGAACATSAMLFPGRSRAEEVEYLHKVGTEKGIDIGTAYNGMGWGDYRKIILNHCNSITPENSLKPRYVAANESFRNFARADEIYDFATSNGKKFHGHTLFWHQEPIKWAESNSFSEVKQKYGAYIREVVSRYPKADSWDVFNEIFEEKTKFRNTFLIRKYGIKFIEFCLKEAKQAAPDAKMVINDYNLECAGNWCGSKRRHALSVVRDLRRRQVPIDVVGIQGHLSSKWKPSPEKTLAFIKKVEALGLDVHISELDVNDINFAKDVSRRDQQVANYYYQFLSRTLSSKAVKRVTFWGIADHSNWIRKGQAGDSIRGADPRPALFDLENQPKPAFYSVLKALKQAPVRITLISALDAQIKLKRLGFDPGTPDGIWGRRSTAALNELRQTRGMAPTTELDLDSQKLLISID